MAKGDSAVGPIGGFPQGTAPDSDHIASERSRLRSAAQRHFAQNAQQAAPPKQKGATGGPAPSGLPPRKQQQMPPDNGGMDLEDEM